MINYFEQQNDVSVITRKSFERLTKKIIALNNFSGNTIFIDNIINRFGCKSLWEMAEFKALKDLNTNRIMCLIVSSKYRKFRKLRIKYFKQTMEKYLI